MYYTLRNDLLLRGWQRLPFAIVQKGQGEVTFFSRENYKAILDCDGQTDIDSAEITDKEREFIKRMEKEGIVIPSTAPAALQPEQEYKAYDNRYIRTAQWSITGRCNLRCKHCYMSAPDAKLGELPHATIMEILDQLADCGVQRMSITGGEPLIRKDFMELVEAILAKGIRITTIYSNGVLVKEKLLDNLASLGIHPEFNMSYDGVGWHDWLRGQKGAEVAVLRAFELCRAKGFPTAAEMCLHEHNKHLIRESINKLAELGCRAIKTVPISDVGAWHEHGYGASMDLDEALQLYVDYIPHYYEDGKPMLVQLGGFFMDSPDWDSFVIPSLKVGFEDLEKAQMCGHARNTMYISPEGRALPCIALSGMDIQARFPLIRSQGVRNCITDSAYMRLIDTRASEILAHNSDCHGCKYARYCQGGCRASALEHTPGDLLATDKVVCKIYKEGWIKRINDAVHAASPNSINRYVEKFLKEIEAV